MRSGLEEGGHGGAAQKSGQPWVTAAESSHLGGRMLLGDMPGEDKQRLFYSSLFIPGGSVYHDNSPVISARSLVSCQAVMRGLRSEALIKPVSLGHWHAPCPCLRACLLGWGEPCGAPKGRGSPPKEAPGRPGPLCSDGEFLCYQEKDVTVVDPLLEARHGPILPLFTFSFPKALAIGSITST